VAFALAVALLIARVSLRREISEDSAIGIFFVASMALGVALIALRRTWTSDVTGYLFGSILAVTALDVKIVLALAVAVSATVLLLFRALVFYAFDEESARAAGLPTRALHYTLIILLALVIVAGVKMVGIILISAFLILPGTIATLVTRRMPVVVAVSVAVSILATLAGLMLSNTELAEGGAGVPPGAAIVLTQFAVFAVVYLIKTALPIHRSRGSSRCENPSNPS